MNLINTKITTPAQLLLFVIQILNANAGFFTPRVQAYILVAVAGLQSIIGVLQAFRNPDGTPARVAWNPLDPKGTRDVPKSTTGL